MRESPVDIDGLAGTLLEPEGPGPWACALIIAGSGPTDREGNNAFGLKTDAYRLLAESLADRGVASLRFDKRGIGASRLIAPPESDLTIETFVADAVKLADWLSLQPRSSGLAIIGHSEGALIGALVAYRIRVERLVYLCGPGVSLGTTVRRQLSAPNLPENFRQKAISALDEFDRTGAVAEVPAELATIFRPSVQPFLRSIWNIDPRDELEKLLDQGQRMLVVSGWADLQISREESARLFNLGRGQNTSLFADMSHTLKFAKGQSPQALYSNPDLPLMPGLADGMAAFIKS